MNSSDDLSNFQSFEASGGVWVEEPAPAADVSGGVSEDVWATAITSLRGAPNPRVQITMNPPDGGHWTAQLWKLPGARYIEVDPEQEKARDRIRANSDVIFFPVGENVQLEVKTPGYRQRNRDALIAVGRYDLLSRLAEGRIGEVQIGEPVTPEFSDRHIVDALSMNEGEQLILGWDFGLTPACTITRLSPGGYLDVLAAFQGVNMGMRQLIERHIQPWFANNAPRNVRIIHTGDPNGIKRDDSNSNMSAVKVILEMLGGSNYIPGPVSTDERRTAIHEGLNRNVHGGSSWVRLDKRHCQPLIKALSGGAHYKKDASGTVIRDEWVKNIDANVMESFMYICHYVLRRLLQQSNEADWKKRQDQKRRNTSSYQGNSRTGV